MTFLCLKDMMIRISYNFATQNLHLGKQESGLLVQRKEIGSVPHSPLGRSPGCYTFCLVGDCVVSAVKYFHLNFI